MVDLPFLLDKCEECGSKWRPGDRDASNRCLVCGSANVTPARPMVIIVAGAAVLGIALAGIVAATRTHQASPASGSAAAGNTSTPSYVAPISTGVPSEPAPAPAKPAAVAAAASAPASSGGGGPPEPGDGVATADEFPSLNCPAASGEAARKVCASPTLTKMDEDLAIVYSVAGQNSDRKQTLLADQDRWRRTVLETCVDENCMIGAYKERTEQLAGNMGNQ